MAELITLSYFHAEENRYYVYQTKRSAVDQVLHYHNYYQVCFVVSGSLLHQQEGYSVRLMPGEAFVIPPGFPHSLHFESKNTAIFSLAFEEALFHGGFAKSEIYKFLRTLQRDATEQQLRLRLSLDPRQREGVEMLLTCLVAQQKASCPSGLSPAPSLISSILYFLAQAYFRDPDGSLQLKELTNHNDTMLRCAQYIDSHYSQKLTLEGLSREFGLSRSAFCTAFRQYAGVPLRQYVAQKRIQEAQLLMRAHPELSLGQIAQAVGYEDDTTFYRNFLRIIGTSPSQYRRLHGQVQESPIPLE